MIAVDTNLLVYAHRSDSPWFEAAQRALRPLVEGNVPWGIPWPCIHELFAISTHPKIYRPPTELPRALEQVAALLGSPSVILLSETAGYWPVLQRLLISGQISPVPRCTTPVLPRSASPMVSPSSGPPTGISRAFRT